MKMRVLELLRLFRVAGQTRVYGVRVYKSRRSAGVRIVARSAITLRPRMLHLRLLDLFRLLSVAGHANRLGLRLGQHYLSVFRRLVAGVTRPPCEGDMGELLHEVRLGRLGGVMALHPTCGWERGGRGRFL